MTAVADRLGERVAGRSGARRLSAITERAEAWPALLLLGLGARVVLWLAAHPLHHDEALYGAWARLIASGQDPLLLTAWVDKPPLVLYLQAAALRLFGPSDLALRLPGIIAGALAIPLLFGCARRAYDVQTAKLATALLAACAFAIQFSPTAFTDPWLVVWLLAGAWAALAGRAFWAGLAVGLAVASKQQGLLAAPLIIALLAHAQIRSSGRLRPGAFVTGVLLPGLLGFGLVFGPMTWWDSLRWAKRPSFWDRSLTTYGGLRIAAPTALPGRVHEWLEQLGYLFGPPVITALLSVFAAIPGLRALGQRSARDPASRLDLILSVSAVLFLALHVVVTFQPWDRYLLPLAPLCALLAARGLVLFSQTRSRLVSPAAAVMLRPTLALVVVWSAFLGATGRFPVGSDHGAYSGVRALASELRSLPPTAVIYYHSLGWHYDYYLFDAPQERRWWESAHKSADDAANTLRTEPEREQWLVLPGADTSDLSGLRQAFSTRGLMLASPRQLVAVGDGPPTELYRIVPLSSTIQP